MFTSFRQSVRILMLLLFCSFGMQRANASHFAAADIVVDWIGADNNDLTYKITLFVYKACEPNNASLGGSEVIRIGSANAAFNISWSVSGGQLDTLDQLCDTFKSGNRCRDPQSIWPAFVRRIYDTTITLPSRQSDWVFSWTNSARNGLIKNLAGPSGLAIYIEAGVNNLFANNSAPRFLIDPLPYICVNQPAFYLNGPFDVDGDSLETLNQAPFTAATAQAGYQAGYSLQNPVAATLGNPYNVNLQTGTATFTPTITGLFVLAFRCNEYQKGTGVPTGHVYRDVQISVLDCAATPPDIDSIPVNLVGGANISTSVQGNTVVTCPNTELKFDVSSTSKSFSNKVIMESNNTITIPTSTFTIVNNGSAKATGTFVWTPTNNDVGEHTLIVTAKDSTCNNTQPIVLKNYRVILIRVIRGIDAGPDLTLCAHGGEPKQIYVRGAEGLIVNWSPEAGLDDPKSMKPMAQPVVTTDYIVNAPQLGPGCKNTDTITVNMDTSNQVKVFPDNPIILCRPDYLQLEAVTIGKPPLSNIACGTGNPSSVTKIDSLGIYSLLPGDFDTLGGSTAKMPNDVPSVKQQFLLRKGELWESGLRSSTIKAISFEVPKSPDPAYEYSNFKISMKCTNKTELKNTAGFETGMNLVYTAPGPITLPNAWHNFVLNEAYNWDTTQNLIIEICFSSNATVNAPGNDAIVKFVATNYVSTLMLKGSSTATDVCGATTSTAIGSYFARPLFGFTYSEAPSLPFEYTWYPSTFLSDSTIQQPLAYVPKSTQYIITTAGRSGCDMKDTADIYIPVHNYTVMPVDTAICFNEGAPMRTAGGGFTFKWYKINDKGEYEILSHTDEASCWNCADPVLKPLKTTTYKIAVYDSVWCIDTLTAKITVKPLPDIKILNRDTAVKYGQSIQLMASGARIYNWSPVGSLSNANTSFPVATPTEPTTYIAGGIGANGCRAFDTLNVSVDYRDNLFVPSGFSPNNDGKNDLFKVANLTFQRVIEFRVFNRWGQEVFMANDNRGWDGAWKGEPQDMDSYTYTIKVGFPDGYIETYRGSVTLIR